MVLWSNQVINPAFTPAGLRVDVVPTVQTFLANIQAQIGNFQSYRIPQVDIYILPQRRVNTSSVIVPTTALSGYYYDNLPMFATVRLTSDEIPNPSLDAFMSYKNVQYHCLNRDYKFTFKPVVPASASLAQVGLVTF